MRLISPRTTAIARLGRRVGRRGPRPMGAAAGGRYRRGEYLATERELFRIEELFGSRAFVENCMTGELIDVGLDELEGLRPVGAPARAA